ncbi:SIR2 family protein [Tenacibaculum sp. 190524A02b]|uniref:SIR2 family protein n=1 Tax=Tenacibaculum vairaonense TaxID=3137860 RepID=A0ABP1FAA1_9FLAO
MEIAEFINNYKNHPVLFVGTGLSLRYLTNSYTWDGLLSEIAEKLTGNSEYYLDIKARCTVGRNVDYAQVGQLLEEQFNSALESDRNGKFSEVNDVFYENMKNNIKLSRFKIYVAKKTETLEFRASHLDELKEFRKIRKNIGSIITTNYDTLIEHIFGFNPLIGNEILLSNPYGSVYKIHGCCNVPERVIISTNDYANFEEKYHLIRAQLLSLFIHNPIIFLGYSVSDDNIKKILKTIFTYVQPNSELAEKIRNNFLLVEFEAGSTNTLLSEHDIDMDGFATIRINKLKTDNYSSLYNALSDIHLQISAMDVRKVQSVVKEIYAGGDIKVSITEDLDALKNDSKILAIGSSKTISYQYQSSSEMINNYFEIIEESNKQLLSLIDKYRIQSQQYFPIYGFSQINTDLESSEKLKEQQYQNIMNSLEKIPERCQTDHSDIEEIYNDDSISKSYKDNAIFWGVIKEKIPLKSVEEYLKSIDDKNYSNYRKILCAYDYMKFK